MKDLKKYNRKDSLTYAQHFNGSYLTWLMSYTCLQLSRWQGDQNRVRVRRGGQLILSIYFILFYSIYFITEHHLCQQSVYQPALAYFQLTIDRHFSVLPVL